MKQWSIKLVTHMSISVHAWTSLILCAASCFVLCHHLSSLTSSSLLCPFPHRFTSDFILFLLYLCFDSHKCTGRGEWERLWVCLSESFSSLSKGKNGWMDEELEGKIGWMEREREERVWLADAQVPDGMVLFIFIPPCRHVLFSFSSCLFFLCFPL